MDRNTRVNLSQIVLSISRDDFKQLQDTITTSMKKIEFRLQEQRTRFHYTENKTIDKEDTRV